MKNINHLLKKYDVPGPRYTSYPTVPAWVGDVGAADYSTSLKSILSGDKLSLYFHLPFCENLCHFCGCMQVITKDHSRSAEYVQKLIHEINLIAAQIPQKPRLVSQIHFGGGTPNFIKPAELTLIMQVIRQHFDVLPDAEIAIEMHPRTSTREFCENLATLGFNRISLGLQDLDPKVQKLINRNQTYEMTRDMVESLRLLGFNSFNFDLVYGLPGQSYEGWMDTLGKVLKMKPNRMAIYSYAHVPWVRPVQRTFEDSDLPTPEMKINFFETALQFFSSNGYQLIGMDHFALHDDELAIALKEGTIHRNFMGYSTRSDAHQIGMGVSAISYVGGNYFQNAKDLKSYYPKIDQDTLATHRGYILNADDALRRDLITQIMCRGYVDIKAFEQKWKIKFKDYFPEALLNLANFQEDNLLKLDANEFKVIDEGSLFLRNMAMVFDAHLEGIRAKAKNPTFSRTI
ncbi:MAG: hypothetical protein ACD_73C00532G0002 [uncultured bacterium]|nr:MAG: hypothetical protein ACD_73C00532G0002 [uncultured bacterium]